MSAERDKADAMYQGVDDAIKEDLFLALEWARKTLTNHEGAGHIINITAHEDGVSCNFMKPEWAGDHSGRGMYSGSEAVVISVCDYLSGL